MSPAAHAWSRRSSAESSSTSVTATSSLRSNSRPITDPIVRSLAAPSGRRAMRPDDQLLDALGNAQRLQRELTLGHTELGDVRADLPHEEGIAGRRAGDAAHELGSGSEAASRRDQRTHTRLVEAAESDRVSEMVTPEIGDGAGKHVVSADFVRAVGPDQEHRCGLSSARQMHQQRNRRWVGPVQVVEHHEQR